MMSKVLITGGTGLVGKRLTGHLIDKGYQVVILTRSVKGKKNSTNISYAAWDIKKQLIDFNAVQSVDFIIQLAGAGVVDKRWTVAYKKEILESRTMSSKLIIDTLNQHPNQVKAIICASAIGWYGPDKENGKAFIETDDHADDFLGQTCFAWEKSIDAATSMGIRICKLRTGIVLSNDGGALVEFKKPIRYGIAGILGTGNQMISWIHIDDLCRMYIYAIENNSLNGVYNAVSAPAVSNKQLTLSLATAMKGKFFIPLNIPSFVLKLIMGDSSVEVLKSTTVSNDKIKETGFTFQYPTIKSAIAGLIV